MFFFIKTDNPRPTFSQDMTAAERQTMLAHVAYWSAEARRGAAVVFGPVMDPRGVYGIAVYKAADEAQVHAVIADDPANGLLHYEVWPMPRALVVSVETNLQPVSRHVMPAAASATI